MNRPLSRLLVLAAAAALLTGCPGRSRPPDVLLIVIDTMRADRLGVYGSSAARTPNVDALAANGVVFENAAAPMPITRPSHASLFTSLHPREHGVVDNSDSLGPGPPTVAEAFRDAGYETAAFVGVRLLAPGSGIERGFGHFEAPKEKERPADRVASAAIEWIRSADRRRPLFVWVHFFDPHLPYAPPPAYVPGRDRDGRPGHVGWEFLFRVADEHGGDVPKSVLDWALTLYAGEVEHVDRWIGALVGELDRRGRDERIVALTADHGECFDHGVFFEHVGCVSDAAIRIPLVFRAPGVEPGRDLRQVGSLDVAPTLLALAGLEAPAGLRGRNLLDTDGSPSEEPVFVEGAVLPEGALRNRVRRNERIRSVAGEPARPIVPRGPLAVRTARWKLVRRAEGTELYDLRSDPGETVDVAKRRPDVVERLSARLDEWLERHPLRQDGSAPSPELVETLRSLGYTQ